jgi:hypothetical protein
MQLERISGHLAGSPYCPVASNYTEGGKAKNRRVGNVHDDKHL